MLSAFVLPYRYDVPLPPPLVIRHSTDVQDAGTQFSLAHRLHANC